MEKINSLQESLIPAYQDKWKAIALSTKKIDPLLATKAVREVYKLMGKQEPKIRFFNSPRAIKLEIATSNPKQLAKELGAPLLIVPLSLELLAELPQKNDEQLWQELQEKWRLPEESRDISLQPTAALIQDLATQISPQEWQNLEILQEELREELFNHFWEERQQEFKKEIQKIPTGDFFIQAGDFLWQQVGEPIWHQFGEPVVETISNQPMLKNWEEEFKENFLPWLKIIDSIGFGYSILRSNIDISLISQIDYCVSVLNWKCDEKKWKALESLVTNCGWVYFFEKTCVICHRPTKLLFDEENRLHGEGEAAIEFLDNYQIFAYQNVILPEKYGRFHPHQWQPYWLLSETNAELRRVLIQGIGYGRICQELGAIELDSWREYTLLKINSDVDVEPIYLLKMICPSTGHIHVLRVPPTMKTAREAISWTNWGVDPEEFSVAT